MLSKSIIKFLKLFKPKKIISIVKKTILDHQMFYKNDLKEKNQFYKTFKFEKLI